MLHTGDRVEVIFDGYGGMLGDIVGQQGRVTKVPAGGTFVGIRFDHGVYVMAWMVVLADGTETLRVVKPPKRIPRPRLSRVQKSRLGEVMRELGVNSLEAAYHIKSEE